MFKTERARTFFLLYTLLVSLICIEAGVAADSTWTGGTNYNTGTNWTPAGVPSGAGNRAIFSNTGTTNVTFSVNAPDIGRVLFDGAAQVYTFNLSQFLTLNGTGASAGILNQSANQQTFNVTSRLRLENASSLTGNNAGDIIINNDDRLRFLNTSTAGNSTINNNTGNIHFRQNSSASSAIIVSDSLIRFRNNSTAGAANITNNTGTLRFDNTSTGGTATIINHATLNFNNNSDAQNSQITNDGTINFNGNATAGSSTITNQLGGVVDFDNNTTADNATIVNDGTLNLAGIQAPIGIGSLSGTGDVVLGNNSNLVTLGNLNQNDTISGSITAIAPGTSGITKTGTGILTLSGVNTYRGGTTIDSGTISIDNDNRLGAAVGGLTFGGGTLQTTANVASNRGVTLNASGGTFNTDVGTTLTLSGVVGGPTGSLTKEGQGILTLSGANTYGGTTTINDGGLVFTGDTSNLGGNIINNAELAFVQVADFFFHHVISGAGTLLKNGIGNLRLTDANTYIGTTTINGGTLTYTGDTSGLGGNIINNSALVFDQAADSSFNQVISNGGTVTKSGAGNLSLTGANTYAGDTTIIAGTLTFTGDTSGLGGGIINNAALVFNQAANSSFNQVISGGGTVTKTGAGTLTFMGANTYTGGTFINGGTLSIDDDSRLGAVAGGLTFGGGALQTTADIGNARAVTLNAGGGTFNTNLGTTFTLSGVIGGMGPLTKAGGGNLTLSSANTYTGNTTINSGVLTFTGDTSGLGGNIINNAALAFVQAADSSFNQVISGGGTVTKTGLGNLTLAGANTYSGNTTISAGTLTYTGDSSGLGGNIINNSALVFNQAADSSFNQMISGIGTVTKTGGGTLTFTGANTYTGLTTINQGTLLNNGSLASAVTVNPGATYGGNGSSGNLINNGTVSPGSSTGTLTVNGNYSGTGSLVIEFDKVKNDLLKITGMATLTGGSLNVTTPVIFGNAIVYTILSADGGVIGEFSQVQVPSNAILSYLPTAVQLVAESSSVSTFVQGGNAGIVAKYLDAIMAKGTVSSDLQTVFDALGEAADQGGNALRNALDQISPDPYREIGYLTFDQTSMINQSINTHQQRILNSNIIQAFQPQASTSANFDQFTHHVLNRSQRHGIQNFSPTSYSPQRQQNRMPALGVASPGGANLPVRKVVQVGHSSAWIEPYGSVGKKKNSSPLVGNKSDTYGITMGGDTLVAPKTYVGLLGGLVKTDFDWTQHRGDGHVKGYYGGMYGLWLSDTGFYVDGQVLLGGERIHTKRNIRFQTINRQARESHNGFVVFPEIELGYLMNWEKAIIQPFLNYGYTAAYERAFTERGANSLNVHSSSKTSHFSRSELGSVFSYFFACRDVLIYPSVQLSWVQKRHLGSHGKDVKFKLSGQNFGTTVYGDNRVRNLFSPGVGLTAQFKNGLYITGDVKGEVGSGERAGQFMIEAGYTF